MSSDYSWLEIDGFDTINGVEVPYYTSCGTGHHYLNWAEIRGKEAKELTSPYGSLEFAVGSGDDFHCFDYSKLPDGHIVVHSTINSETGSFIGTASYDVVWPEEAVDTALGCIDAAMEWLYWGGKPLRHTQRGWNQDPYYFARCVARYVGDPRIAWWKGARICKPNRRSVWSGTPALPHNPAIVRLHDPEAIVLRFGEYDSEPIGWRPDDNVFKLCLDYMNRYGWVDTPPG